MGHRKENEDARCKRDLLYCCNISTRPQKKNNLDFELQLCVAEECQKPQQLVVHKCSLKSTSLYKQKERPCPCRIQAEQKHCTYSTRKEMLGLCTVTILPKYRKIWREIKAVTCKVNLCSPMDCHEIMKGKKLPGNTTLLLLSLLHFFLTTDSDNVVRVLQTDVGVAALKSLP